MPVQQLTPGMDYSHYLYLRKEVESKASDKEDSRLQYSCFRILGRREINGVNDTIRFSEYSFDCSDTFSKLVDCLLSGV